MCVFLHFILFICAQVLQRFNMWRVCYVQFLLFSCFVLLFRLRVPCVRFHNKYINCEVFTTSDTIQFCRLQKSDISWSVQTITYFSPQLITVLHVEPWDSTESSLTRKVGELIWSGKVQDFYWWSELRTSVFVLHHLWDCDCNAACSGQFQ